jgi:AbrB family looped-hinge helix DNA binding protein
MTETTVTERGQTAIPAEIRRRYNLKPRAKLVWLETRHGLTIIPVSEDPLKALRGLFKGKGLSTKDLLAERRAERERERREDERWIRQHLRAG